MIKLNDKILSAHPNKYKIELIIRPLYEVSDRVWKSFDILEYSSQIREMNPHGFNYYLSKDRTLQLIFINSKPKTAYNRGVFLYTLYHEMAHFFTLGADYCEYFIRLIGRNYNADIHDLKEYLADRIAVKVLEKHNHKTPACIREFLDKRTFAFHETMISTPTLGLSRKKTIDLLMNNLNFIINHTVEKVWEITAFARKKSFNYKKHQSVIKYSSKS